MENRENIIEIVEGDIRNRNVTMSLNDYDKLVKKNAWKKEMYRSYYSFDETFSEHVSENQSVKGYDGLIYLNNIVIDIDKGDIIDSSFQGYVMDCISQLLDKGLMAEDINVWFSGSGYHIKLKIRL